MKKVLLLITMFSVLAFASNFRDGMLFYKKGDFTSAKKYFELAIQKDHAIQANFMLGKIYLYGEGVLPDRTKAIKYLKKATDSGNIRATCYLAEAYLKNDTNKKIAVVLLKEGLEKNLKECKRIARIYDIKLLGKGQ